MPADPTTSSIPGQHLARPSVFYRAGVWRLGLAVVRALPLGPALVAGAVLGGIYRLAHPRRCRIVCENLEPLFAGDPAAARRAARRLFVNFGRKLVDLMRFEAREPITQRFVSLIGWDTFARVQDRGRGVLLLTPHLGNWELGAPLLLEKGVKLLVITQAEPGQDLTGLRQRSRSQWGIETLVIGQDPFAFVAIIQRLQEGVTVALLTDRPPDSSAVEVEFCGRPFLTSLAPATLARASGCGLVGVYVVEEAGGYRAQVLDEFTYDRRELGDAEGRRRLSQQIMDGFAPVIRRYADQWYHFVPLWPGRTGPAG